MYRIAFKTKHGGLRIGLKSMPLEVARYKRDYFNSVKNNCIIVTENYVLGEETFKEVM